MSASTSTVRLAGSSGANPFACIAAGIACLWGPAHGGANEAVLTMLNEIGDMSNVDAFMQGKLERKEKVMGFGQGFVSYRDSQGTIERISSPIMCGSPNCCPSPEMGHRYWRPPRSASRR